MCYKATTLALRLSYRSVVLLAAASAFPLFTAAQPTAKTLDLNQHLWASYSGDHRIVDRWGVHFDAQWRRADLGRNWQQYQLRPAVNFELSRRVLLTAGYAFTKTYPYGDFPARAAMPEHRIYEQALVRHHAGAVRFSHRLRMEQRFIRYPDPQPPSWTYQNRFRYLAKVEIPLRGSWYLPAYDEILIGIPPNYGARPFDQNRVFVGIGRTLPRGAVEAGYMNQFIGQRNGRVFEFNNTLFIAITSTAPLGVLWGN